MPAVSALEVTATEVERLRNDEGLPFRSLLPGDLLESAFQHYGIDFRDRVFSPDVTLMTFCSQLLSSNQSCRAAVARVNFDRTLRDLPPCSASTSAYCQAREKLPGGLIRDLALIVGGEVDRNANQGWLWQGRHIKMLDGSTLTTVDTPANQAQWPQHGQQAEGVGFPIMRVVALLSLATGAVLEFKFGPYKGKGTGELSLARELVRALANTDIIIADRYYCSYFFIAELQEKGVDIITRQHGSRQSDFRQGQRLGSGDHIVELVKPPRPKWMNQSTYDNMPQTLTLREVKVGKKDREGEEIVIVTTLTCPKKYTRTELAACSQKRWNAEIDLRSMKTVMGMDVLACKSPEMVTKEIWTYVLAYNLVRQLITRAASEYNLEPRQISFTGA